MEWFHEVKVAAQTLAGINSTKSKAGCAPPLELKRIDQNNFCEAVAVMMPKDPCSVGCCPATEPATTRTDPWNIRKSEHVHRLQKLSYYSIIP